MVAIVILISILSFALFLLSGKQNIKRPNILQNSSNSTSCEPVQKRGANLYAKPIEEYNEVEFDRFAQAVEMRYRVRERYDK